MNAPAYVARVSQDGTRMHFDQPHVWKSVMAEFAGREVEVYIRPRRRSVTEAQRGYWFGELIAALMRDHGYATKKEANDALVRAIWTMPWERIRPSFSRDEMTREDMAEAIDRASYFLINEWLVDVAEPEPDPVRRWEQFGR
jgi:hypothetical protein